jgi:hypothetical protein
VLFLEDLTSQPQLEMEKCFRHLGVDSEFQVASLLRLNEGGSKIYDTRILRYLRTRPWSGFKLARLGPQAQDRLLKPLGLRRKFTRPVKWNADSLAIGRDKVLPDSRKFLEAYGKPEDFWNFWPESDANDGSGVS